MEYSTNREPVIINAKQEDWQLRGAAVLTAGKILPFNVGQNGIDSINQVTATPELSFIVHYRVNGEPLTATFDARSAQIFLRFETHLNPYPMLLTLKAFLP